ncbi:MAG: peptidylprolyl isomerase [Planctomycetota bacterium]
MAFTRHIPTVLLLTALFMVGLASRPATALVAATADPAAAEFNALIAEWGQKTQQIGAARDPAEQARLRGEALQMVDQIVAKGLEVYQLDPAKYAQVGDTLAAIASFFIAGDPAGDGGDQYEKALPLVEALIEAGAAESWGQLYSWAGVAAAATNDFDKAEVYFAKAGQSSAQGGDPRVAQLAGSMGGNLATLRKNWEKEQQIRAAEAAADDLPRVKLTTSKGEVVIELFENEAPVATASFLSLVKKGFYDGVVFHRVLPGFMAQGGDPTGTGSGGPGYNIKCECHQPNYRHHFRGSLSMAHAGRDTGGSQFFLTFVPTDFLDGRHTVFGRVVEGMDVAASLKRIDPQAPSRVAPDKIVKAEVLRDRGHGYEFEKLPER